MNIIVAEKKASERRGSYTGEGVHAPAGGACHSFHTDKSRSLWSHELRSARVPHYPRVPSASVHRPPGRGLGFEEGRDFRRRQTLPRLINRLSAEWDLAGQCLADCKRRSMSDVAFVP